MLFSLEKKEKEKAIFNKHHSDDGDNSFISSQDNYLRKHLKNVDFTNNNQTLHFQSNGRFALYDLLIFFAKKIKNSDIIVSSFNISEIGARALLSAFDQRLFKSIAIIINSKSQFKKSYSIIENKIPVYFAKIHAKIVCISNSETKLLIVSSGNLSSNDNIERGFITNNESIFDFDYQLLNGLIKQAVKSDKKT